MTLFHEALTSICLVYLLKYRSEKRTKGVSGVLYFQYEYICSSEPENVALADRYSVRNELRRLSQSINDRPAGKMLLEAQDTADPFLSIPHCDHPFLAIVKSIIFYKILPVNT
jgi:hypothetical protein